MGKKMGVLKKNAPKDFEKIKSKVGKKKKAARNDTKTDYKVKQLQMPAQNALAEKGEEVTHRRLGLLDLLGHLQHHSSKVRKEAFEGLRELCTLHEGVLRSSLARIVDATTIAPIDSHAEVRSAFATFQSWLIGAVSRVTILAFAPSLALHVRSALSHVSSEVREDGLALLELYLRDLGGSQLFNQAEVSHLIGILCQLTDEMDTVLPCLYQLLGVWLQPAGNSVADDGAGGGSDAAADKLQVSLHLVLQGRFQLSQLGGRMKSGGVAAGAELEQHAGEASPVWTYCLRAWLQAGELPFGSVGRGATAEAAGRPGRLRILAAATLERALRGAAEGAAAGRTELRPSPSQVAALLGIVRRGEWPLRIDTRGTFRALADSINLRMARVFAFVANGKEELALGPQMPQLSKLAGAAAGFLEDVSTVVASAAPAVAGRGRASGAAPGGAARGGGETAQTLMVSGRAGVEYVLRTLDMLWACAAPADGRPLLTAEDLRRLLGATTHLAGEGIADGDAGSPCPSALLAVPLTASLLGLRPCAAARAGAGGAAPAALRTAWPEALEALGEPSFVEMIEGIAPGTAATWTKAWPRLLFYLGASDPAVSSFLLSLLLELAKKAANVGSVYESLFAEAWPLLVPFLGGRPGVDMLAEPPAIVLLPDDPNGPQGLAATLVQHFPKMTDPLVRLITQLVCRWSSVVAAEAPAAGKMLPRLSTFAAELLLTAVLERRSPAHPQPAARSGAAAPDPLAAKVVVAASVLAARPRRVPASGELAAASDRAALRLAGTIADWLMHTCAAEVAGVTDSLARKRLVLESMAWPLAVQVLRAAPELAPRVLSFLFFCASRLPWPTAAGGAGPSRASPPAGLEALLAEVFDCLVVRGDGVAVRPSVDGGVLIAAAALPALPLPAGADGRAGSGACAAAGSCEEPDGSAAAQTSLGRLFVAFWMCASPPVRRPAAYARLAELCAEQIAAAVRGGGTPLATAGEDAVQAASAARSPAKRLRPTAAAEADRGAGDATPGGDAAPGSHAPSEGALLACATLLEEAIAYRSSYGFADAAGSRDDGAGFAGLPQLRTELDGVLAELAAKAEAPRCWAKLRALLPLL